MSRTPGEWYDRHAGRYGPPLARGLVGVAALPSGARVLDVGCGTGQLTAALADAVGAPAVAAIDPSEDFVAACRERVPGADVRVAGAEDLPFADGTFDAALAQLVVNLVPAPAAAVAEMARVTRPGGAVVACVWHDGEMPLLEAFWDAAATVAPESLAGVRREQQVGHPGPERLVALFEEAGLEGVDAGALDAAARYDDFADLWAPFAAGIGRSGALLTSLDGPRRDQLERAVRRRLGDPDGPFTLGARAWYAIGRAGVST